MEEPEHQNSEYTTYKLALKLKHNVSFLTILLVQYVRICLNVLILAIQRLLFWHIFKQKYQIPKMS